MISYSAGPYQLHLLPPQPYEARYTAPAPTLGFAFDSQAGVHAFNSDRLRPFRTRANSFAYVPPGCAVHSCSQRGGEYMIVRLPTEISAPQASDLPAPRLRHTALRLRLGLLSAEWADPLEMEALIARFVADATAALGLPPPRAAGWLTPQRLARLDALIDAHLAEGITIAKLAAALDLSEGFFNRAVKASLGVSPQAYLLDRKLSRARALLRTSHDDLSQIALAAGFSSHAHLSAACRRYLGTSPSQLRDCAKSRLSLKNE